MADAQDNPISANDLAALMIKNGYVANSGVPVMLYSCNTGVNPGNGAAPFAQQLANILNATVSGEDNYGWMSTTTNTTRFLGFVLDVNVTPNAFVAPVNIPGATWQNTTAAQADAAGPDTSHLGGFVPFSPSNSASNSGAKK